MTNPFDRPLTGRKRPAPADPEVPDPPPPAPEAEPEPEGLAAATEARPRLRAVPDPDAEGLAAAAAAAPAAIGFGGLPAFRGLGPAAADRPAAAAEAPRADIDPAIDPDDGPESDPGPYADDDDPDQAEWDDYDDTDAEEWAGDPPPPPAAAPGRYQGDWAEWATEDRAPAGIDHRVSPPRPVPELEPGDPDDDPDDYEPARGAVTEWDIPDYDPDPRPGGSGLVGEDWGQTKDGAAARARLRDRSGRMAVGSRTSDDYRPRRTLGGALIGLGTVAVVGAAVAVVVSVNLGNGGPTAPPAADAPSVVSAAAGPLGPAAAPTTGPVGWTHGTAGCTRTEIPGGVTIGAGPGGTDSGPAVILAFEWAYYVERSAAKARALVTPDAAVSRAETIQAGIDSQPAGVRYCVYITPADTEGRVWAVELHEQWPGEPEPSRYGQTITTTEQGGRTLITAIARR